MSEKEKIQRFVKNMDWMIRSGEEAEAMTTPQIVEMLCRLDNYHVSSLHRNPASSFKATCIMPSAIKINSKGLCQTGEDLIPEENSKPKPPPTKPDGD